MARCPDCNKVLGKFSTHAKCRRCRAYGRNTHAAPKAKTCLTPGCDRPAKRRSGLGLCDACAKKRWLARFKVPCENFSSCGNHRTRPSRPNSTGLCRECWLQSDQKPKGPALVLVKRTDKRVQIQDGGVREQLNNQRRKRNARN